MSKLQKTTIIYVFQMQFPLLAGFSPHIYNNCITLTSYKAYTHK